MSKLGKQKEAIEYYQKALKIEPENRFLQMDYANTLAAFRRADEALEIYNKLKSEYPNDYRIYAGIGKVFSSMDNLEKSIRNFKKALALNPAPETYLDYAVILERAGNLKEAIHYIKFYLGTTPERDTPQKINAQKALAQWERKLR